MTQPLLKSAITLLFIICTSTYGFSQFNDAYTMSYSYGIAPVNSQNTGNDILEVGTTSYEVSVCDDPSGNNSILGYRVGTLTGFVFIGQGGQVLDPDVCLVNNNAGIVYAVVAYYDVSLSQFMWQIFTWIPAQSQFTSLAPDMLSPGVYNKSINIDSDDVGHFAIVWDQPGDIIAMVFGEASSGLPPQLGLGGSVLTLDPGSEPDICYYRNAANNYWQIDVVYKNIIGVVAVDFYKLVDLLNAVVTPTPAFRSPIPDLHYKYPRIACPITATGDKDDFTVVVEDSDGNSTWYIKSFNANKCCSPAFVHNIYNDGNSYYSPYNVTMVPNTKPVVAYDDIDASIWIGWNLDNSWGLISAPGAPIGNYPIAVLGDKRGRMSQISKYMIVPYGTTLNSTTTNLSIAGSKSSNVMFTYDDNLLFEINSKALPHYLSSQNLRSATDNGNIISCLSALSSNYDDSENILNLKLYDITGKLIVDGNGTAAVLLDKLLSFKDSGHSGIFLTQLFAADGYITFSGKFVSIDNGHIR